MRPHVTPSAASLDASILMSAFRIPLRSPHLLTALAWILALGFAAWIGSDLVLRFITPAGLTAVAPTITDPRVAAQRLATRSPMAADGAIAQASPNAPRVAQGFELVGVATGFGNDPGFALLKSGGSPARAYLVGDEIAPGVRLVSLQAQLVEIDRGGIRETVRLSRQSTAGTPAPIAGSANPAVPAPANLR